MSDIVGTVLPLASAFIVLMLINYVSERRAESKRVRQRADAERWRQFRAAMGGEGWLVVLDYYRELDL